MSATVDTSLFGIYEEIILTKNGTWLSNGEEITHAGTVLAFSKNLFRCKDGFEIRLGTEKKSIYVEDTLYFVKRLEGTPTQGYQAFLNDGRNVDLDPSTLRYETGRLTCRVLHPNENTHEEAKFLSVAYYEILKHAEPEVGSTPQRFFILIQGQKFLIG
jgi:hypothetical protein